MPLVRERVVGLKRFFENDGDGPAVDQQVMK